MSARLAWLGACAGLAALILLCLAWELWLAPLRPGGSWLALKALPLLAPLRGVLRGDRYTLQWSLLLVLAYLAEGLVRAWSEASLSAQLALAEVVLVVAYFACAVRHVRATSRERQFTKRANRSGSDAPT